MERGQKKSPDFVQSLARGLEILEIIGKSSGAVTVAEVSEHTDINRATSRRLLLTLERMGYIKKTRNKYVLTPRVMELGFSYLSGIGISDLVAEELASGAEKISESLSLTTIDGFEIVYVARAQSKKVMTVALNVGARLPAWNTSMGRVLLSHSSDQEIEALFEASMPVEPKTKYSKTSLGGFMDEIQKVRKLGYCIVDQELELGLRSVALPILRNGECLFAVNAATANVLEPVDETLTRLLPELEHVANKITSIISLRVSNSF